MCAVGSSDSLMNEWMLSLRGRNGRVKMKNRDNDYGEEQRDDEYTGSWNLS